MCSKSLKTEYIDLFLFQLKQCFLQHEVKGCVPCIQVLLQLLLTVHVFESMCNQDYHRSHVWRAALEMYSIGYCISSVDTWVLLLTLSPARSSLSQVSCQSSSKYIPFFVIKLFKSLFLCVNSIPNLCCKNGYEPFHKLRFP